MNLLICNEYNSGAYIESNVSVNNVILMEKYRATTN